MEPRVQLKGKITYFQDNFQKPLDQLHQYSSFLFQNPETHFFYDTVKEELKGEEDNSILEALDLTIDTNKSPFDLSEGQKRRFSLMTALQKKAPMLFLDEPSFGLDEKQVKNLVKLISVLKYKKFGLVIISHDKTFYSQFCDQVVHLEQPSLDKVL